MLYAEPPVSALTAAESRIALSVEEKEKCIAPLVKGIRIVTNASMAYAHPAAVTIMMRIMLNADSVLEMASAPAVMVKGDEILESAVSVMETENVVAAMVPACLNMA